MEFQIFVSCSLNKETISLQEATDRNLDLHLLLFRSCFNMRQSRIQQRPHPLLVAIRSFSLVQEAVELIDFICIQEFVIFQLPIQITDICRRYRLEQNSFLVIRAERLLNILIVVLKIKNKGCLIIRGTNTVQSRKSLHRCRILQFLIHIHSHQLWLIKTGLIFIRNDQYLIAAAVKFVAKLFLLNAVHAFFCILCILKNHFSGKCN